MLRSQSAQGSAHRPASRAGVPADRQWLPLQTASLPPRIAAWVAERGSLTRRLRRGSGRLELVLLRQTLARPLADELRLLGLRQGQRAWVREVLLLADGNPVLYAHSVMHVSALRSSWRLLARVGLKPVGDAIFERHGTRRGAIRLRRLAAGERLHAAAQAAAAAAGSAARLPALWARRSPFIHGGHALWITEVFLPAIAQVR